MRNCDAVGLHHRGPHLYRRVRGLGRMDRIRPSAFLHSRHSYLCAVANLANVGRRHLCVMSMADAEIQQSGRGKFEKVGEKGVPNCDAVGLHLNHGEHHLCQLFLTRLP